MKGQGFLKRPYTFRGALLLALLLQWTYFTSWDVDAVCLPANGCGTALAYYTVQESETLDSIGSKFQTTAAAIVAVNSNLTNVNYVQANQSVYIPFKCECINDQLNHRFSYQVGSTDTVDSIVSQTYENLTEKAWIAALLYTDVNYINTGASLAIPVNCSCGDPTVNSNYGLFLTYVLEAGTDGNLSGLASEFNISTDLLQKYNPSVRWDISQDRQYAFIPVRDKSGNYPVYSGGSGASGNGASTGLIVGAVVGGAIVLLGIVSFALYCYCAYFPRRQRRKRFKLSDPLVNYGGSYKNDHHSSLSLRTSSNPARASFGPTAAEDYKVDKSVQFSYEELANATDDFSVAKKIGEGGFAMVYYGEIRQQKLAIKRMNLQATKEFTAELQVLTNVHHTNLVQLIGYCTVEYLFLIYEFVENGTLDQHLHSSKGKPPLSWTTRVQVALDAARGLEYIHEHTKPTYIHRDIKSANILVDKQLHAKVADFGLAKLTESGLGGQSTSNPTRVVGTWGYMPPEYARFGEVSPMVDVYAFGVVLYEIISGKAAIVRGHWGDNSSSTEPRKEEQRALVSLFDPILKDANGKERLAELIDPRLDDNYPLDSVWKMAQLAGACTQENPELRPTMRKAVVALMTLSSSTQDWEVTAFARDGGLMAGR